MRSILGATGVPESFGRGPDQGNRPGYAVKGVLNPARPRPDWKRLVQAGVRPIFDNSVTGPYSDPFPILTGSRFDPASMMKAPRSALADFEHREVNS